MSRFDPLAILGALERHRVAYVVVGSLAGVLHGTDLVAESVEITPLPKPENVDRLSRALADLGGSEKQLTALPALATDSASLTIRTDAGVLTVSPCPSGTGGYDDLRRAAQRESLGKGIRPAIASAPDLLRSVSVDGRDALLEHRLRRLIDLEQRIAPEL